MTLPFIVVGSDVKDQSSIFLPNKNSGKQAARVTHPSVRLSQSHNHFLLHPCWDGKLWRMYSKVLMRELYLLVMKSITEAQTLTQYQSCWSCDGKYDAKYDHMMVKIQSNVHIVHSQSEGYTNVTSEGEEYHYPECVAQHRETYHSFCKNCTLIGFVHLFILLFFVYTFYDVRNVFILFILCYHSEFTCFHPQLDKVTSTSLRCPLNVRRWLTFFHIF